MLLEKSTIFFFLSSPPLLPPSLLPPSLLSVYTTDTLLLLHRQENRRRPAARGPQSATRHTPHATRSPEEKRREEEGRALCLRAELPLSAARAEPRAAGTVCAVLETGQGSGAVRLRGDGCGRVTAAASNVAARSVVSFSSVPGWANHRTWCCYYDRLPRRWGRMPLWHVCSHRSPTFSPPNHHTCFYSFDKILA